MGKAPSHLRLLFPLFNLQSKSLRELPAVSDDDLLAGRARTGAIRFNGFYDIHTLGNTTEHDMLAVQPGGLSRAKEELRAVGVGAGVSHRQDAGASVLEGEREGRRGRERQGEGGDK